jgi:pimeloyl-ACP methyl ester carboxylesterase
MSAMERPRVLLVPNLTEIEWLNRPELEEWAEVASYDAPGVGDEPPVEDFGSRAIGRRGLEEIERRGWDSCIVVADEFGVAAALHLAARAPEVVGAMALGHARLSNRSDGERAPLNHEVHSGGSSLIQREPRAFVRQLFRMTGGEQMEGGYGEGMVQEYRRRVPVELMLPFWDSRPHEGQDFAPTLLGLDVPLLLAQHKGCLLFTDEGFEDAVKALPHARAVIIDDKPSTSKEFARLLGEFCSEQVPLSA